MRPKLLVLLAAHNGSPWIVQQVDSILAQTEVDITLVISDDCSTDDTRSHLAKYSQDRRVRLTGPSSPTGAAAKNFIWLIGHAAADGFSFVALADQDDIWLPGKLKRATQTMVHAQAAGYSCATRAFWAGGRTVVMTPCRRLTRSDFFFESAGQGCTYVLTADFYARLRRFLLQHPGLLEPVHYHDWVIYALSRVWSARWIFDQEPFLEYRQHDGNDTGARSSLRGINRRVGQLKSGWYARQLGAIAQIALAAAPGDPIVADWNDILKERRGIKRWLRTLVFCWEGGAPSPN